MIGGPIASALGGVTLGYLFDWIFAQINSSFNRNIWEGLSDESENGQSSKLLKLLRNFSMEADKHLLQDKKKKIDESQERNNKKRRYLFTRNDSKQDHVLRILFAVMYLKCT